MVCGNIVELVLKRLARVLVGYAGRRGPARRAANLREGRAVGFRLVGHPGRMRVMGRGGMTSHPAGRPPLLKRDLAICRDFTEVPR